MTSLDESIRIMAKSIQDEIDRQILNEMEAMTPDDWRMFEMELAEEFGSSYGENSL